MYFCVFVPNPGVHRVPGRIETAHHVHRVWGDRSSASCASCAPGGNGPAHRVHRVPGQILVKAWTQTVFTEGSTDLSQSSQVRQLSLHPWGSCPWGQFVPETVAQSSLGQLSLGQSHSRPWDSQTVIPGTVGPGTVVPRTVVPRTVVPGTVDPGTVVPGITKLPQNELSVSFNVSSL